MSALGCLVIAAGLTGIAFAARPLVGFTATLGAVFLVPSALRLPHAPQLATFPRLVMLGLLLGLARQLRRGTLSSSIFRFGRIHLAYAVFLAVTLILGVGLADPFADPRGTTAVWFSIFDQALFFVLCVACLRAVDNVLLMLGVVAAVLTLSSVIALVEHWTGNSWAHWWFQSSTVQRGYSGAEELAVRRGQVRVRAAADFAVAFAWLSAALLPVYLPLLVRVRGGTRALVAVGLGVTIGAIYWSYTRSVLVGLIVILVAIGPLSRNVSITKIALGLVLGGALLGLAQPAVSARFSSSVDQNSLNIRAERNPVILERVAPRAVGGLGFTTLDRLGFPTVDQAYISLYAGVGVVGLASFGLLLAAAVASAARGLRSHVTTDRLASASAVVGMLAILVGAGAFDGFTSTAAGRIFALLAALGLVAGEPALGPARWRIGFPWWRLALAPLAFGIGLIVAWAAPTHHAAGVAFKSLSPAAEAQGEPNPTGVLLVGTVCDIVRVQVYAPGVHVSCRITDTAPGFGRIYVSAHSDAQVYNALAQIHATIAPRGVLNGFRLIGIEAPKKGKATLARTAPIWLTILGLGAALMLPEARRRTERALVDA